MDFISEILIKPVQEWDSLICTSKCVKNSVDSLLIDYQKVLSDRINIKNITLPELPIIPLGVHTEDFDFSEEIQIEDIQICEEVQRGLESRAYNAGRISKESEQGLHHFQSYYKKKLSNG